MRLYKLCIRPENPLDAAPKPDYDEGRECAEKTFRMDWNRTGGKLQ